jgi:hypothetical protein
MRPLPLSGYLIMTNRATLHTTRATLNEQRRSSCRGPDELLRPTQIKIARPNHRLFNRYVLSLAEVRRVTRIAPF